MHELGLLLQTAETVERVAKGNHVDKVLTIDLDIGEATGVIPEFFTTLYPAAQEQYPVLSEAKLEINMIPAKTHCLDCDAVYNSKKSFDTCVRCHSTNLELVSGAELQIRSLEYEPLTERPMFGRRMRFLS